MERAFAATSLSGYSDNPHAAIRRRLALVSVANTFARRPGRSSLSFPAPFAEPCVNACISAAGVAMLRDSARESAIAVLTDVFMDVCSIWLVAVCMLTCIFDPPIIS